MPSRNGRTTALAAVAVAILALAPHAAAQDETGLPPGDDPSPTPFSRLADAGEAEDHDGADHIIVHEHTRSRVKPSGVTYSDHHVLYKVLTPAGCRGMSVLAWGYEPWSSFHEVREASVIRGDERIPVDVAAVHDLPAPQSGIYWNSRVQTLQLPRLEVNDGIEVRTFKKGYSYALLGEGGAPAGQAFAGATGQTPTDAQPPGGVAAPTKNNEPDDSKYIPPMPGEYFDIILFRASVPILEKKYVLSLPADKRLHSQIYNGPLYSSTTYTADSTNYAWWALDVPGRPSEPRQADASDDVPKVVVATVESWEAKSRWFFDVNEGQFDVTPAIQEKVDEIFREAGLTNASEEKKAEALVHWVAQNIRYSGQTMGEGEGFTLHSGSMIFEQRSGVCKDIAGMLITMMRAAGMDSYGAMTMAGSKIEEVPADQFNHCVCALRKEDGSFVMYDPTWVPYVNDIWSKYECEQQYLTGTPEGEGLATIPFSPPEESPLGVTHDATLAEDGTLTGSIRFETAGIMDGRLRNLVGWRRAVDVKRDIAELLSPLGNRVTIAGYTHPKRDDFGRNMWLEIEYSVPGFAFPVEDGLEFASPVSSIVLNNGWLFRAGAQEWPEERETKLFLWFTQLLDAEETIRLPRGYEIEEPPSTDAVDETYASFEASSEQDGRDLVITQRAEVRRRMIPPDGYKGFVTAVTAAQEWGETVFRAEKGGDR